MMKSVSSARGVVEYVVKQLVFLVIRSIFWKMNSVSFVAIHTIDVSYVIILTVKFAKEDSMKMRESAIVVALSQDAFPVLMKPIAGVVA